MDKRSLIFVMVLTLSFFLVQYWFSDTYVPPAKQEQVTPIPTDLPTIKLYLNSDEHDACSAAVILEDNQYLTLAWKKHLPEELYVKKDNDFKKITLITKEYTLNAPVFYLENSDDKIFDNFASLNDQKEAFSFCFDEPTKEIEFNAATIDPNNKNLKWQKPLKKDSIVLVKEGKKYLPYGIFDINDETLKPLNIKKTDALVYDEEKFFVLENEYFQLVFSNIGGAVAEINLPFQTQYNQKSVVKKIDIDRIMMNKYPQNDYFPAQSYYVINDNQKMEKIEKTTLDSYYPLLRRSSFNNKKYYAFNVVNSTDNMPIYKVKKFEKNLIEFEGAINGRTIVKTFSISSSLPYCIDLSISVESGNKKFWLTSGVPEVELILDSPSPELKCRILKGEKSSIDKIDLPKTEIESTTTSADWICNSNSFFGIILNPINGSLSGYKAKYVDGKQLPTRLSQIDPHYDLYPQEKFPGYELLLPLKGHTKLHIFSGPFDDNILRQLDKALAKDNYTPDYLSAKTAQGFMATISMPFAKILYWGLKFFYYITHSWGFAILLLTIFLRIAIYPLNTWSIKSQYAVQKLSPKTKAIQDRYKKDPKKAQIEIMKIYRESGVNPMAGGCLPILIQLPILFGMYLLLKSSFEIRGEAFIPGWIDNLSAPDILFSWNYPLLFIGTQFHLLPFLLGIITFIQQKLLSPTPKDKSQLTDQQRQMQAIGNIMGIVLIFMFYKLPSGLNIYYLFFTILGIGQQLLVNKKLKNMPLN